MKYSQQFREKKEIVQSKHVSAGFDGFVDFVVKPVNYYEFALKLKNLFAHLKNFRKICRIFSISIDKSSEIRYNVGSTHIISENRSIVKWYFVFS